MEDIEAHMIKLKNPPAQNEWGLALAWYPEYLEGRPISDFLAKIYFMQKSGMSLLHFTFDELDGMDESQRDELYTALDASSVSACPHFVCSAPDADRSQRKVEADYIIEQIRRHSSKLRAPLITCTAGNSHRYDRVMPFSEKIGRFSEFLRPIVDAASELQVPVAIENHADYYVSEIVEIIEAVPGLGLLFDTANALHIGEHPAKAALDAAPYTIGTHFKDHYMVRGDSPPLHYEIRSCALGDGDAMLSDCYRIIRDGSPYADKLIMLLELFKADGQAAMECWEKSVSFINQLLDETA